MDNNENQSNTTESTVSKQIKTMKNDLKNKVKAKVKRRAKMILMKAVSSVLIVLVKIIIVIIVSVLLTGFLNELNDALGEVLVTVASNLVSVFMDEDGNEIKITQLVEIVPDSNGTTYHIEFNEKSDEIIERAAKTLGKEYDPYNNEELIKKCVLANLVTQFPNLGGDYSNVDVFSAKTKNIKFQGSVKIKRIMPDKEIGKQSSSKEMKTMEMKYVPQDVFDSYISNNDIKALEVFSLSDDNSELITATWSYSDKKLVISKNANIDYKSATSVYSMPFEYPLILLGASGDEEFADEVIKLVENSKIELAIIDNVVSGDVSVTTQYYDGENMISSSIANSYEESVNTSIKIASANCWWCEKDCTYDIEVVADSTPSKEENSNEIVNDEGKAITVKQIKEYSNKTTYNITVKVNEIKDKSDAFKKIYNNSDAKEDIDVDNLFEALSANSNTANMVELTKYLVHEATDVDTGVTDFESLDIVQKANTVDLTSGGSSYYGNTVDLDTMFYFISSYENTALLQYINGQNTNYNSTVYISKCITEDKKNYKCVEDIGMNNGTRNFGFGVCHYNPNDVGWMHIQEYSEEGINIKQDKYLQEGTLMDVKVVDNVKKKIIQRKVDEIKSMLSDLDLNDTQILALVDISYQRGNIGGFYDAYKQYGNTDALRTSSFTGFNDSMVGTNRSSARWDAFHSGIVRAGTGEVLNLQSENGGEGENNVNGDGYDTTFTSSSGKTYKIYLQTKYPNTPYWGNNVSTSGCGPTSAAIILSGFGKNDTPDTVARSYAANGSWAGECKFFTDRGLNAVQGGVDWDKAVSHLKSGNPMVASINSGITINGSYYDGHFITFLDYKNDQIYIGDPYKDLSSGTTGTGWVSLSFLKNSGAFGQFFYVSK